MNPLAAKMLVRRSTLDILEVTTHSPCTVSRIAQTTGVEAGRTWRAVRKLCKAGLLEVAGTRARAGRPLKLYRATAREFIIPASIRHSTVGRTLSAVVQDQLEHSDQAIGERFFFDGDRWRVEKLYNADARLADKQQERWLIARLSHLQKEELAREVIALFEKYASQQLPGGKRSIVHFACVSEPDSDLMTLTHRG